MFKAAAIQLRYEAMRPELHLERAGQLAGEAADEGAQLIVLPELVAIVSPFSRYPKDHHEGLDQRGTEFLVDLAKETGAHVAASVTEREEEDLYNTALLVSPDGILGRYRKIHLWRGETKVFIPGAEPLALDTPLGRLGLLICFDVEYPQEARGLALDGVEVVALPSAFIYDNTWDIEPRARAVENGLWIVASNFEKRDGHLRFCGHAKIIDPTGNVVSEVQAGEGYALAEIDTGLVQKERKRRPYLSGMGRLREE